MSIDISNYKLPATTGKKSDKNTKSKEFNIADILNKDISLFGTQWSAKKKEEFYSELEVLLRAGLDLKTVLDFIEESQTKEKDKVLLRIIREYVIKGDNLSEAMRKTNKFSDYEIYSLQIAEESGKLPPILTELSQYFNKSIQFKRLLTSALSYPIVVIGVALLAMVFLLNFLVPMFADIYSRLNQELPPLTLMIVRLSKLMNQYMGLAILSIVGVIVFCFSQRQQVWYRRSSAWILIHIPIFGSFIQYLYLARFAQALGFLLNAKVPLLKAVDLVKKMVGFYPIELSLSEIHTEILKGKPFYASLAHYKIYPKRMIALLKVGEEANQLDNMFVKVAEQYNAEVEQRTKMIGSLIEPVLIVLLALIVGLVLVSMYLPIFKLVGNFRT